MQTKESREEKSTSFYFRFGFFLRRVLRFLRAPPASIKSSNRLIPCSASAGGIFIVLFFRVDILLSYRIFWHKVLRDHECPFVGAQQDNLVLY